MQCYAIYSGCTQFSRLSRYLDRRLLDSMLMACFSAWWPDVRFSRRATFPIKESRRWCVESRTTEQLNNWKISDVLWCLVSIEVDQSCQIDANNAYEMIPDWHVRLSTYSTSHWVLAVEHHGHACHVIVDRLKVGFHYPSSRPEFKNAPEFSGRQLGPWTRVVETDLKQ